LGYLRTEGAWQAFDAPLESERARMLDEYRERRRAAPGNVRGHLSVAAWCQTHGLRDEERAHRTAALVMSSPSEQPHILKSLGYRQVGEEWLSPFEAEDLRLMAIETEKSLRRWGPKVEKIFEQLHGSVRQKNLGRAALAEIEDPGAIPALEYYFGPQETSQLIDKLEAMRAHEASVSLARLAVFSDSIVLRNNAIRALSKRRKEDYVPSLLQLLSYPANSNLAIAVDPGGSAYIWESAILQETGNRIRVWRTSTAFLPVLETMTLSHLGHGVTDVGIGGPATTVAPTTTPADFLRTVIDQLHFNDQFVNANNFSVVQLNKRISNVLSGVSGQPKSINANDWLAWWGDYSGLQQTGTVKIVEELSEPTVVYQPIVFGFNYCSCFKAGTPVWTESGTKAIEQIQVGDRVLAQNVETGEVAFKPVLHTSVRPPHRILRMRAGDDSLTCTEGHRFWVAGKAWIRACDVSSGQLLHTATGSIPVESVTDAGTDRTYNLVVADFHNYFVGKQAILVQDLPLPRATNRLVPGLQPEW
jgi:hypothetical protein